MNVMLLTAGLGTRLLPYTQVDPKPSIPFMTVPLAVYPLSLLSEQKINHLVFNTHHLSQKVCDLFSRIHWPTEKTISLHEPQILGSGGGIANAKNHLIGDGNFLVLNGDEVILPNDWGVIKELISFHHWHQGIATLLTMTHPEVGHRFGGAWCEGPLVKEFSKTPLRGLVGKHFLGVMVLSDRIFQYFKTQTVEENILYDTLTKAIQQKERVYTFDCECQWFETGNPKDFIAATDLCCQSISQSRRPIWAEYLLQVMRMHSENRMVVEKDYPEIESKVRQIRNFY